MGGRRFTSRMKIFKVKEIRRLIQRESPKLIHDQEIVGGESMFNLKKRHEVFLKEVTPTYIFVLLLVFMCK